MLMKSLLFNCAVVLTLLLHFGAVNCKNLSLSVSESDLQFLTGQLPDSSGVYIDIDDAAVFVIRGFLKRNDAAQLDAHHGSCFSRGLDETDLRDCLANTWFKDRGCADNLDYLSEDHQKRITASMSGGHLVHEEHLNLLMGVIIEVVKDKHGSTKDMFKIFSVFARPVLRAASVYHVNVLAAKMACYTLGSICDAVLARFKSMAPTEHLEQDLLLDHYDIPLNKLLRESNVLNTSGATKSVLESAEDKLKHVKGFKNQVMAAYVLQLMFNFFAALGAKSLSTIDPVIDVISAAQILHQVHKNNSIKLFKDRIEPVAFDELYSQNVFAPHTGGTRLLPSQVSIGLDNCPGALTGYRYTSEKKSDYNFSFVPPKEVHFGSAYAYNWNIKSVKMNYFHSSGSMSIKLTGNYPMYTDEDCVGCVGSNAWYKQQLQYSYKFYEDAVQATSAERNVDNLEVRLLVDTGMKSGSLTPLTFFDFVIKEAKVPEVVRGKRTQGLKDYKPAEAFKHARRLSSDSGDDDVRSRGSSSLKRRRSASLRDGKGEHAESKNGRSSDGVRKSSSTKATSRGSKGSHSRKTSGGGTDSRKTSGGGTDSRKTSGGGTDSRKRTESAMGEASGVGSHTEHSEGSSMTNRGRNAKQQFSKIFAESSAHAQSSSTRNMNRHSRATHQSENGHSSTHEKSGHSSGYEKSEKSGHSSGYEKSRHSSEESGHSSTSHTTEHVHGKKKEVELMTEGHERAEGGGKFRTSFRMNVGGGERRSSGGSRTSDMMNDEMSEDENRSTNMQRMLDERTDQSTIVNRGDHSKFVKGTDGDLIDFSDEGRRQVQKTKRMVRLKPLPQKHVTGGQNIERGDFMLPKRDQGRKDGYIKATNGTMYPQFNYLANLRVGMIKGKHTTNSRVGYNPTQAVTPQQQADARARQLRIDAGIRQGQGVYVR